MNTWLGIKIYCDECRKEYYVKQLEHYKDYNVCKECKEMSK
jgi:hypothetical protein